MRKGLKLASKMGNFKEDIERILARKKQEETVTALRVSNESAYQDSLKNVYCLSKVCPPRFMGISETMKKARKALEEKRKKKHMVKLRTVDSTTFLLEEYFMSIQVYK